jgi:copper chaperone CopZ
MSELTFFVAGMACRRCVREVTARLRDVPGVETVSADGQRSLVRLGGTMTPGDVVAALAGTAFQPEPR